MPKRRPKIGGLGDKGKLQEKGETEETEEFKVEEVTKEGLKFVVRRQRRFFPLMLTEKKNNFFFKEGFKIILN